METVAELLKRNSDGLTRSERILADLIMKNYPVSALGSITSVAESAEVSTTTVARLVQKLGFAGFPEFQAQLRDELDQKISGPITKHARWVGDAPDAHIMNRFTDAVLSNIRQTLSEIDVATFDRACDLISDLDRTVFVVGGRITRTLADHIFLHLQVARPDVTLVDANANAWPHYLLDIKKGDILLVYDIRRYENGTLRLAKFVHERGAKVVLFTDQWQSPVSAIATLTFSNRIEVPSAWDSVVTCLLLNETIVAGVQERIWNTTRFRMEELEEMFDRTKFFRKF